MLANLQFTPLLAADFDTIGGVITFVVVVIGWIVRLVATNNQARPPAGNRPRPPARPRDERLQQEINVFIEEVGQQKRGAAGARPGNAAATRSHQSKKGTAANAPAAKQQRRKRPGQDVATRQAPVTESLGTGVKKHLTQYMTDKVSQEVQKRMAPRVDQEVAADLGTTATFSPETRAAQAPPAPAASRASRFAELLRSPAGVQQAIVLNLILSPPVSRSHTPRR
jgi:hypothetical protein